MSTEALIYIVDNDPAMVESLSWLIESRELRARGFQCPQKFLREYDKEQHGCILLELSMRNMNGLELQQKLKNQDSHLPMIFISGYTDVPLVVKTMKAGALDYLIKPFNEAELMESIAYALIIDKALRKKQQDAYHYIEKIASLTKREIQVLQGILASKQNILISEKLDISLKTVEAHRASLMKKMNVNSLVELIKLVVEYKIPL